MKNVLFDMNQDYRILDHLQNTANDMLGYSTGKLVFEGLFPKSSQLPYRASETERMMPEIVATINIYAL